MRPSRFAPLGAVMALLLPPEAAAQSVSDPTLVVSTYACCPAWPTNFAFLPLPGPVDLLVLEKYSGLVQHFRDGVFQGTALDLAVSNFGERGLLGIAVHPQFASNGFVYLYYSASPTAVDVFTSDAVLENRVERYVWNGGALVSPQLLLRLPGRPGYIHQGGALRFGPDGMLYGTIGDVGRSFSGNLQNVETGTPPDTTSIVFRIQPDGAPPASNPFYGLGGAMQYAYGYGIRNSFGFDFEPQTGVLWASDNGPSDYDEIDRFLPGSNGGWSDLWGPLSRNPSGADHLWVAPGSFYSDPVFSWFTPTVAPTAVLFLQSDSLGVQYRDDLFVGTHNNPGKIYRYDLVQDRSSIVLPAPEVSDRVADSTTEADLFLFATGLDGVVDLETGPDGALYGASFYGGRIFRIGRATLSAHGGWEAARSGLSAFPNPFRRTTLFRVAPGAPRTVRIYDASGRLVRLLHGAGELAWDGLDRQGQSVGAGIYVARLVQPEGPATKIVRLP